jgi:RNA polymerase subunit RPABC4/transcription elongation factor Spt4
MLNTRQIEKALKHCENIDEENERNKDNLAGNEYSEYMRNKGWAQALRFVLEKNTIACPNCNSNKINGES